MALDSFKKGFEKKASEILSGGKGFAGGRGKANLQGDYSRDKAQGTVTRDPDRGVWSLERGPQSYSLLDEAIIRSDTSNPHIKY